MDNLKIYIYDLFKKSYKNTKGITFETYMKEALFNDNYGYYTSNIKDIGGKEGDFLTTPTLCDNLGKSIAVWIKKNFDIFNSKKIKIIEIGAGNGQLSYNILRHLGWMKKRKISYNIVELSPVLIQKQKQKLNKFDVTWNNSIKTALDISSKESSKIKKGEALILSNELADTFPAKIMKFNSTYNMWEELFLSLNKNNIIKESFYINNELDPNDYSAMKSPGLKINNQKIEIQPSLKKWLKELSSNCKKGKLLTIDYGGNINELYKRKPNGTIRAYYKHKLITGKEVYSRFGKQDITVDVNFTDFINWSEDLGWKTVYEDTQESFICEHLKLKKTYDEHNNFFKVLEQER